MTSPFRLPKGYKKRRSAVGRRMRGRIRFLPWNAFKQAESWPNWLTSNILELHTVQFAPSTLLQIIVLEREVTTMLSSLENRVAIGPMPMPPSMNRVAIGPMPMPPIRNRVAIGPMPMPPTA